MSVKEIISGASASTQPIGFGSLLWTRTRTFRVFTSSPTHIKHVNAIAEVAVVRGDPHPDDEFCFAESVNVNPVTGSGGAVDVIWKYVANSFGVYGGDDDDGDTQTPQTGIMSMSIGQTLHTTWRVGNSVPYNGNIGGMMGTDDIEGGSIDNRGTGATRMQLVVNVAVTIETPYVPNIQTIKELTGTRNHGQFLGSPTGYILYKGVSGMNRNKQGIWTATHQFVWDEKRHLRQFPARDFDNRIKIGKASDGDYEGKAFEVFWFQPFPDNGSFGNLGLDVRL
jgi:hypothetical protein